MNKVALKLSVTNCFLVNAGEKYILIDTGYAYEWDVFWEQLTAAGLSLSQISHLILTHHHDDHAGLVKKLVDGNPAIRVVMSSQAKDLLPQGRNVHPPGGGYVNKNIAWLLPRLMWLRGTLNKSKRWTHTFPPYTVRPQDILVTGESQLGDLGIMLPGRIVETPGHSCDSISVLFDDGDCFVGDAAANMLQFAGTRYCVISIDDFDAYYASWDKIIAGRGQQIFPAHGKSFSVEKLKQNLRKNKKENLVVMF